MKLLVTGALGHIGSALIRKYAERQDVELIRILDNLSTQRYCSLFNLPANKRYEFVEGDINDQEMIRRSLHGIDTLIHLAAITDAPSTINSPELTRKVNFEGTKNVLTQSVQEGVKLFLFPSTTSVYGETEGIVDETFRDYKPCTPYAQAKLEAEEFVKSIGKEGKISTRVLRMGTIFGASPGIRFHTAVNKFAYLASIGRPLTVWKGAYEQKRPYLGLSDDIRAFEFLETHGQSGELYNVLTENYTVRQIVEAIRTHIPSLSIIPTKSLIINQKSYCVSNQKVRDLGFEFTDNLQKSIGETISLFKAIKNSSNQ